MRAKTRDGNAAIVGPAGPAIDVVMWPQEDASCGHFAVGGGHGMLRAR